MPGDIFNVTAGAHVTTAQSIVRISPTVYVARLMVGRGSIRMGADDGVERGKETNLNSALQHYATLHFPCYVIIVQGMKWDCFCEKGPNTCFFQDFKFLRSLKLSSTHCFLCTENWSICRGVVRL